MTEPLSQSLFSSKTTLELKKLSAEQPSTFIILQSSLVGLGVEAAVLLAKAWVREDAYESDVRVIRPSSDKWTVAEVNDLIISPAQKFPNDRHLIIVDNAGAMESSASEKLLKTIEEPSSPCTFIFCVEELPQLLKTLQGRATSIINLKPADGTARIAALVEAGATPTQANMAVALAGNQVRLAPLIVADPVVLDAAVTAFEIRKAGPFARGQEVSSSLNILANALVSDGKKVSDKIDATARSTVRVLARELLGRYREKVSEVSAFSDTRSSMAANMNVLAAADAAEREINLYASVPLVLTAFFSSITSQGRKVNY